MPERKHPLAECERCPLRSKKCAPTTGPVDTAKVAFVSRSPGYYDAKAGRPFSGPSGKVLDYLLNKYGVDRKNIVTTNMVLCETDEPSKAALEACRPRLLDDLKNVNMILAGGTEAVSFFTNMKPAGARGYEHVWQGKRVIATNNPALVLRNSDAFPDLVKDFRLAFDPIPPPSFPVVEVINDPVKGRAVLRSWVENASFDGDIIASDLEWRKDTDYVCAGFSRDGLKSVVFGNNVFSSDRGNRRLLSDFYERPGIRFVWHNGKSDTKVLHRNGIPARIDEDTFLISYALDEEPGRHSLEYLLMTEFGWPDYEPESVKYFKKTGTFDYYIDKQSAKEKRLMNEKIKDALRVQAENELYEYNGWDAAGTKQLYELLVPRAQEDGVYDKPYKQYLLPAATAFRTVEMQGFTYDAEEAANLNEREVLPYLWSLSQRAREVTGHPLLSLSSNKQMHAMYYEEYGLTHTLKDTNAKKLEKSTGVEVRKEIEDGRFHCYDVHRDKLVALASVHQEFQEVFKQKGTYIEGLIVKVGPDGKLYSVFNPCGTVSGRSSSREPNFQNVTREGRRGIPSIRTLFRPSPGCAIVQADFSQAELRTCAVLSGEENLLSIYRDNTRSLHKERAAAFYGDSYTKEQYVKSKNINFGVTYGQSAAAFAQMYHMDEKEAQAYIDAWWKEFPQLREWVKSVWRRAQQDGCIVSPFGHKRRFHLITKENLNDILREAVNFLPQNIAGWLTICALCDLVSLGVPVISTVHDSIIADVPIVQVDETISLIKETMESQAKKVLGWKLPFTVDISMSTENWASVEEIKVVA